MRPYELTLQRTVSSRLPWRASLRTVRPSVKMADTCRRIDKFELEILRDAERAATSTIETLVLSTMCVMVLECTTHFTRSTKSPLISCCHCSVRDEQGLHVSCWAPNGDPVNQTENICSIMSTPPLGGFIGSEGPYFLKRVRGNNVSPQTTIPLCLLPANTKPLGDGCLVDAYVVGYTKIATGHEEYVILRTVSKGMTSRSSLQL